MDTAFRTKFTNRFTQKDVELKLGVALNEAEVSSFHKDLEGSIVHGVQIGANYLNVNPGHRSVTVSDWNMVAAITNVTTDDMLGVIHAKDVGFHVSGDLSKLPSYKEGVGVMRADYQGEYLDLVHGLDKVIPAGVSQDTLRAAFEGVQYFYLDIKNGGLSVGRKLVHVDPVGDPRLQSQNEKKANGALYRQQAIDLLMSGVTVHAIWPDYRQNYMNTKWAQFNMDVEALANDKRERIARKIGRSNTAAAYGELAQAQSLAAQYFEQSGVEEPIVLAMPVESIKLMDDAGKITAVPLSSLGTCKLERFMLGVRLPQDAILGDDVMSRFMVARQAKGGTIFRIAAQ